MDFNKLPCTAHTPGGSSSGSAAAVAAGIVPLALGTQTLGSIIRPAAYNGVVGYKPSFGAVAGDGVHPFAGSLDQVGFFTRSAADAAAAFALFVEQRPEMVLTEAAWGQYFRASPAPKLAVIRTGAWDRADAEQQRNFEAQLTAFRQAGAELTEFGTPTDTDEIIDACTAMAQYEAARIYRELVVAHPDKTSDLLKQTVATGLAVRENHYKAALALQARLRADLEAWIAPCDAILTLPATGQAPVGLADTGDAGVLRAMELSRRASRHASLWLVGSGPAAWPADRRSVRPGQGDAPGRGMGGKYRELSGTDRGVECDCFSFAQGREAETH